jgi:2-(3-amino-3-carboxypropyl)histidine synthase
MKVVYVYAKSKEQVLLSGEAIARLPDKVGLVTNIQHLHSLRNIEKQINEFGKKALYGGQILGCRAEAVVRISQQVDAFLYIGTGVFHPIKAALVSDKPVWIWSPVSKELRLLEKSEIDLYRKKVNGSLAKFYSANTVGVIISTKVGQNENKIHKYSQESKLRMAKEFLERKGKHYYLFAADTLSVSELENFPFIDVWINTACSRIADGKANIVNAEDILEHEKNNAV